MKLESRRPLTGWLILFLATTTFLGTPGRASADDPPKAPTLTDAQKTRLKERDQLGERSKKLEAEGKIPEAIAATEAVMAIEVEVLGASSDDAIGSLERIAGLQEDQDDWTAATLARARVVKLRAGSLGEKNWVTANARFDLIRSETAGRLDRDGRLRFAGAKSLVASVDDLYAKGRFSDAIPPAQQAFELHREVLGEHHPETIGILAYLALLTRLGGDPAAALPMSERALRLMQEVMGESHPKTAIMLNNLGSLLQERGDLDAARPMLERALRINQEALGGRSRTVIINMNNLGMLLREIGDFDAARPLLERALRLNQELLGERNPNAITSLNNLGLLLKERGDLDAARPLLERAVRIREEVLGERHPSTIVSLGNLAQLLQARGDLDAARSGFERALRLREEVLGKRHPDTITSLNNLAVLLRERGDLDEALPLLERSLKLSEELLGERHRFTIASLRNLALAMRDRGDLVAARELASRSLVASEARLNSSLPTLSGREQIALLKASSKSLDIALGLADGGPRGDSGAYAGVLAVKGLVAEAEAARRLADRPEARDLRLRLAPLRARLNTLTYAKFPADRADEHARSVRALADEVASTELALARAVDWRPRAPEASRLAGSLPAAACLVDLLRYRYYPGQAPGKPGPPGQDRYVAFVVRPDASPARVELGPADAIDEAVASWRARLQQGGEAGESGRRVARLAWEPLVPHLGGSKAVLISPDGDLAFLPWGALPDGDSGSFLLRRLAFAVVPSSRQLVALAERAYLPATGGLLAVGGVDYGRGEAGGPIVVASRSAAVGRSSLAFGALPGTQVEALAVSTLHEKTHPDAPPVEDPTGALATKGRLNLAMPGKRFLHLATHGYFAPPEFKNALAPQDGRTNLKAGEGMGQAEVTGYYPGLLSGLAWAGAASPEANPSTGVLDVGAALMTAEEVGGLDLKGCELAVLSACETGLGRTAGGEGVLGLQRAFHQAGARTVVASLWRVDDDATRELMTRFYRNLWEKKLTPLEALRQAQLSILDDPNFGDGGNPRLWAAWTLSGDPGGLPRLAPPAEGGKK